MLTWHCWDIAFSQKHWVINQTVGKPWDREGRGERGNEREREKERVSEWEKPDRNMRKVIYTDIIQAYISTWCFDVERCHKLQTPIKFCAQNWKIQNAHPMLFTLMEWIEIERNERICYLWKYRWASVKAFIFFDIPIQCYEFDLWSDFVVKNVYGYSRQIYGK